MSVHNSSFHDTIPNTSNPFKKLTNVDKIENVGYDLKNISLYNKLEELEKKVNEISQELHEQKRK